MTRRDVHTSVCPWFHQRNYMYIVSQLMRICFIKVDLTSMPNHTNIAVGLYQVITLGALFEAYTILQGLLQGRPFMIMGSGNSRSSEYSTNSPIVYVTGQ